MGSRYTFQCPGCGYQAEVSGGGDCGIVAETTTIVCLDCRELFDIVTGYHQEKAAKKAPPYRCPKGKNHRIERWEVVGKCPRCGQLMENNGVACLWD